MLDTLTHLRREDLADLDDAWYVSRGSDGQVRLHRPIDLPALSGATGARRDALVGTRASSRCSAGAEARARP